MVQQSHSLKAHPEAERLRKEAGAYLKKARERAELTQNALAKRLGFEYYTMVSQVEGGRTRVPSDKIQAWAEAVKVPARDFAIQLLKFYDPFSYDLIFKKDS